jgi:hypothetical protein
MIRASEIGTYQFCRRAWWYQLQGYEPDNQADLTRGSDIHEQHGKKLLVSNCVQYLAYGSILLAILTTIVWIIQTML